MCDDFLRQRGDEARAVDIDALVRGVVVAFHLVKFDVSAFEELKIVDLSNFCGLHIWQTNNATTGEGSCINQDLPWCTSTAQVSPPRTAPLQRLAH